MDTGKWYNVPPGSSSPSGIDIDASKVGNDWYKQDKGSNVDIGKDGKVDYFPFLRKLDPNNPEDKKLIDDLEKKLKNRDPKKDTNCK
jgi:predicted SnoaL-like aldol condensation-catalyzing enzyme